MSFFREGSFVLAIVLSSCATDTLFVRNKEDPTKPLKIEVPNKNKLAAGSIDTQPPLSVLDAYNELEWRCMATQLERDRYTASDHNTKVALTIANIALGVLATTLLAIPDEWGDHQSALNRKWVATGIGAAGTGVSTFMIGYGYEKRIDAGRESLQRIGRARDRARAEWNRVPGQGESVDSVRLALLREMADACNEVPFFESALKSIGTESEKNESVPAVKQVQGLFSDLEDKIRVTKADLERIGEVKPDDAERKAKAEQLKKQLEELEKLRTDKLESIKALTSDLKKNLK